MDVFQFRFVARLFSSKINKTPALHKVPFLQRMAACLCLWCTGPSNFFFPFSLTHSFILSILFKSSALFLNKTSSLVIFSRRIQESKKSQEKQIKKFDFSDLLRASSQAFYIESHLNSFY